MSKDASNAMDISATLDELLKDDEMFNELQDLPLNVGTRAEQCESQDLSSFDLSFLFSDLNGGISDEMWSTEPSVLGTSSQYIQPISHHQSDSTSTENEPQQTANSDAYDYFNQWAGQEVQNVCERAGTSSLSETFCTTEQQHPESTTLAAVQHDHSYARLPRSEKELMEVEEGSDSAEDSSSNHDAGYETMSASMSPDSKSSPLPPPLSTASLSLLPDPVKLIDERIKYFMSTQQVSLSAEEKETLIAEGLPVPTTLPLTKVEEKALKSVRRKIRNKVAAQESRKKKKEYIDSLEERVKRCSEQNHQLQKKVDNLETENRTLLQQLQQLQALVARTNPIFRPMQLGSCLMVVVLCFAILFGNMLPYKVTLSSSTEYTSTATVRSRALLSLDTPHYHGWVDYYKSLLLGDDTPSWSMLTSSSMADQPDDEYSKPELDTNKTNEPHSQLITAR